MKYTTHLLLAACGIGMVCAAGARGDEQWPIRAEDNLERTLPLSGEPRRVVLDNLEGSVHVTASGRSDVRIRAHRTVRADTDADLALANKEVKLEFKGESGTASAYYAAPWRCDGGNRNCEHQERRFYSVTYDLDVDIPSNARLFASTVNRGDVDVKDFAGPFEIRHVNGRVVLTAASGSGEARTVNGPVDVTFAANPKEPCSFRTVNGSVNVTFARQLSADLLFKTMNGEIYSDFEVTALAKSVSQAESRNGRFVYRSNRERAARAAGGGPELRFETLNGNINLRTAKGGR